MGGISTTLLIYFFVLYFSDRVSLKSYSVTLKIINGLINRTVSYTFTGQLYQRNRKETSTLPIQGKYMFLHKTACDSDVPVNDFYKYPTLEKVVNDSGVARGLSE